MSYTISTMHDVFTGIIGHSKQIDYLRKVLATGKVAHAYCFAGTRSIGKSTIAKRFACELLGIEADRLHTSPNISIISNGDEKSISVEQIRAIRSILSLSAFGAGRKVAIIDNADSMTVSAQNALLKTLEEPSKDTVIILIAHNPSKLLPTILSRSAVINFFQLKAKDLEQEIAKMKNLICADSSTILQLSLGRPGVAIACLDDEVCKSKGRDVEDALVFLQSPLYKRIALIEKIIKEKDGREQKVHNMIELCRTLLHFALLNVVGAGEIKVSNSLPSIYTKEELAGALRALQECEDAIGRNINVGLSLSIFASSF